MIMEEHSEEGLVYPEKGVGKSSLLKRGISFYNDLNPGSWLQPNRKQKFGGYKLLLQP